MPKRRAAAIREPRGAKGWILKEFSTLGPGKRLSTTEIGRRLQRASQKSFHKNSVYNALRSLVSRRVLAVARSGRQKFYQLLGTGHAERPSTPRRASRPAGPADAATAMLPHKLALGEILILAVGDGGLVTATNLHGRLVLERHPIPG